MTDETIPSFKYHPDPIGTGAIAVSDQVCECCGKARGYIYKASFYAADEIDSICPWCIANGSAARKYDGMFCDDYPLTKAGIDSAIVDEVTLRTPGFETWQQEVWLTHCSDACAYLGDATKADLVGVTQGEGLIVDGPDWAADDILKMTEYYEPKGSPAFYKLQCIHCGEILYGMDAC